MAGKTAAPVRMHVTAFKTCQAPTFWGNLLSAGKPRLKAKLHRHRARVGFTLRGPTSFRKSCPGTMPSLASFATIGASLRRRRVGLQEVGEEFEVRRSVPWHSLGRAVPPSCRWLHRS